MAELSPSTLIATLGGQPQVLTFALDDLLGRGDAVDEVVMVHVAPETPAMQQSLAVLAGAFTDGRYAGRPCRLRSVVLGNSAVSLEDIADEAAAEATWQTLHGLLGRLKAEGRRLHLVVTGGPRLIGLMAMSTATLLFDHQDRLWHLYTPRPLREAASGGAILHVGPEAGARLIQVPMAPWGAYFPALRLLASATSAQVLAAQARWMDEGEQARCRAVEARLTGRQALSAPVRSAAPTAEALVYTAEALIRQGDLAQPAEVCRFLLSWPGTPHGVKEIAHRLVLEIGGRTQPDELAMALGQQRQLEDVVAQIVHHPTASTSPAPSIQPVHS